MFNCEFNVFSTKSITLKFICSDCNEEIEETIENIPSPNLLSDKDTYSGTLETDCAYIECPNCHKNYTIQLCASMYGGELFSDDLDENTVVEVEDIEEEYYEDYSEIVESNSCFFETFSNQMETNKKLFDNTILDHDLQIALNKLLYANIITCLETYLSDALINSILGKEIYLQKFVENFRDYQKFSFHLNEIYKIMDDLKKR